MSNTTRIILRFFILVLIQVLVLNQIRLGGYVNPYLYVLFILMLPFVTPGWLLLLLSFLTGFIIDMFSNTGGVHTAASVLVGFFRPALIKLYFPKEDFDTSAYPGVKSMGFQYFAGYALILVFIHHTALFFLEIFRFSEFGLTLLRVILSTLFTMITIMIAQFLFLNKK